MSSAEDQKEVIEIPLTEDIVEEEKILRKMFKSNVLVMISTQLGLRNIEKEYHD